MSIQMQYVNGHDVVSRDVNGHPANGHDKKSVGVHREAISGDSTKMTVPNHIGIIMDGNGRWAVSRGLPRIAGHHAGVENVRNVLKKSAEYGIKVLTIYAFSTENWRRPAEEVNGLMRLLGMTIQRELKDLHKNGVRIVHSGRLDEINRHLQEQILHAVEFTQHNERITLNVAFNYGGRTEILDAMRRALADGIEPDEMTEERFSQYLYTGGLPDPDLIIRTGGEWRLSNFMVWQAAYAEYYSTPAYWPDFDDSELDKALLEFGMRERRFGRVLQSQE